MATEMRVSEGGATFSYSEGYVTGMLHITQWSLSYKDPFNRLL